MSPQIGIPTAAGSRWFAQALVSVQTPAPFHLNCRAVETNCYRALLVANNVENDGAEQAETS